jgi:nitronate monooxygenase
VLVAQGVEAGGHRGSFVDDPDAPRLEVLPLLEALTVATDLPLVGAGGIASPEAVAAVRAAGASAAQVGTAFMRCPEAGTSPAHREALCGSQSTVLTRAFTGRLARGIRNPFIDAHDAVAPRGFPELHHVTAPVRAAARQHGDADLMNLWAGTAYALARAEPAADVVRRLLGR